MLTDGLEDAGSPLLVELLVRLVQGCLPGRSVNPTNVNSYLRKLFKQKCTVSLFQDLNTIFKNMFMQNLVESMNFWGNFDEFFSPQNPGRSRQRKSFFRG